MVGSSRIVDKSRTLRFSFGIPIQMATNDEPQDLKTFQMTFDLDTGALNENRQVGSMLIIQDSSSTTSTNTQAIPEFGVVVMPVLAFLVMAVVFRRRRRGF